jgi:hypothetical protein
MQDYYELRVVQDKGQRVILNRYFTGQVKEKQTTENRCWRDIAMGLYKLGVLLSLQSFTVGLMHNLKTGVGNLRPS